MTRVLVVEDDPQTAEEIIAALATTASRSMRRNRPRRAAEGGRRTVRRDRARPHAARRPRRPRRAGDAARAGVEAPVLILSALSGVDERVRGLRAGGDDYLTKPFDFLELTARLDVLLRRRAAPHARPCCASASWRSTC